METVSVDTISETGGPKSDDCKKNLELSDKKKNRSGKKRKSRKQENELKNIGSYITIQNGKSDEAVSSKERKEEEIEKSSSEEPVKLSENSSSTLPSKSCQQDLISCEDPVATLHHKDPIFSSREDSLPVANRNSVSRKKLKRREKKKEEDASCEEKMLNDAEKTTNEDQVYPPKNSLSNSILQEGLRKHTQESCEKPGVAQLCTGPDFSTRESSRQDATSMTCSQRRKRKKEGVRNTQKESSVDIQCTNVEVAAKCNAISEAEGLKSMNMEKKTGASVVINSCLKSKDNTVEQREGTDVKLNETVSQTQKQKTKKKKKRTQTTEVYDPVANTLATSIQSRQVECMGNNDESACQELMSNLGTKRVNSATGEENGLQSLGKTKQKKTDKITEITEDDFGASGCNVRSKKRKGKKKKMSSATHETADMEVCDPSGNTLPATVESESVECLLDHLNIKDVENGYGNAGQEFVDEDMTSKTEKSATREKSGVQNPGKLKAKAEDESVESKQDALGPEVVSDIRRKKKKKKINKNKNCESVANMDCESVQCLSSHSHRESVENCDVGIASKDLASKTEDTETEGKGVQNVENTKKRKKDKKGVVDQDALEAEGVSKGEGVSVQNDKKIEKRKKDKKVEVGEDALGAGISKVAVKTKKKKLKSKKNRSLDHKTDNMEDISLPRNDEEVELNSEKLESSFSSTVLVNNNVGVAQGVGPPDTGDVPRCSCEGQQTKKLLVFDLNGILADIVQGYTGQLIPDGKVSYRSVFLRPFVHSFLDFCFERFDIGIWSSRHIGLDYMTNLVIRNHARNLLFCFGQNICTTTKFKSLEKSTKPLFLKDLRRVWERFGTCFTCGKQKYDETNTLLVDDSPDKSLCNPPHTGIFPHPYQYTNREDSALGPEGELRKYLERLADATSVQKFVAENPIGQTAITETHESWEFYSKVVEAYSPSSTRVLTM